MAARIPVMKIVTASALPEYRLELRFDDGVAGTVDLSELVGRGVFAAWRDPESFKRVQVSEHGAVEWPGEIDLCPDALYLRLTAKSPEEMFPALRNRLTHA